MKEVEAGQGIFKLSLPPKGKEDPFISCCYQAATCLMTFAEPVLLVSGHNRRTELLGEKGFSSCKQTVS